MERNEIMRELRARGKTLQSIGDEYGISRERVRQLTEGIIPNKVRKVNSRKLSNSLLERIERWIDKSNIEGCWEWVAGKSKQGYGRLTFKHNYIYAHRAMWECANGEIPEGLDVLHSCANPSCVNPNHLFLGTHQDNMKDRNSKARFGTAKLSVEDVKEIRRLFRVGEKTVAQLSERFDINKKAVYNIVNQRSWKLI